MLQSYFNIMFFNLHEFWRKRFSISKIQVLKNTIFVFKPNFNITKMAQIVCNFSHTYLYFKDLIRTDFLRIYVILRDCIKGKIPSF